MEIAPKLGDRVDAVLLRLYAEDHEQRRNQAQQEDVVAPALEAFFETAAANELQHAFAPRPR
jgi:hypothetical protein